MWRWAKSCRHHRSRGTNCQGHLPGDVVRKVCFMAWGVGLVTILFHPTWGCGPWVCRVQRTERPDEAAPDSLAACPGLTRGGGGWQGLLGFLRTPHPGRVGHREVALLTANQTCSLKAELCLFVLYDFSFGEEFGSPIAVRKFRWWRTGQKAACCPQWQWSELDPALGLEEGQARQPRLSCRQEGKGKAWQLCAELWHTISFDSLPPVKWIFLSPLYRCDYCCSEREHGLELPGL